MCLAVAVALAFALPAIQSSRQSAYLKPYETKYGIHYPAGMLEQYCDAYGKDRQIAGFLTYGSSGEITVSKTKNESQPYLDNNSDFLHFGFNTVIYGSPQQLTGWKPPMAVLPPATTAAPPSPTIPCLRPGSGRWWAPCM